MTTAEDFKAEIELIDKELNRRITSIMVGEKAILIPLSKNLILKHIERNSVTDEITTVSEWGVKTSLPRLSIEFKIEILAELEKIF